MKRVRWTWVLAFGLGAVVSACKQNAGEPCQVVDDCSSGLMCCIAPTAARGTCAEMCSRTQITAPNNGDEDAGSSSSSGPRDGG